MRTAKDRAAVDLISLGLFVSGNAWAYLIHELVEGSWASLFVGLAIAIAWFVWRFWSAPRDAAKEEG